MQPDTKWAVLSALIVLEDTEKVTQGIHLSRLFNGKLRPGENPAASFPLEDLTSTKPKRNGTIRV